MGFKSASYLVLLIFGISVPLTLLLSLRAIQYRAATTTYDAAPVCASPRNLDGCRYQGPARVVKTYLDKYSHHWVDVTFDELSGQTASGIVPQSLDSDWASWKAGDPVDAEMWQGIVTRISGVLTDSSPDSLAAGYTPAALISGGASALLLIVFVAARFAASRSSRRRFRLDDVPPPASWR